MNRVRRRFTGTGVVIANFVPLAVLFVVDIDVHAFLVVYWLEAGVIGVVTMKKIRRATGDDDPEQLPDWEYSPFGTNEKRQLSDLVGEPADAVVREFRGTYVGLWLLVGLFVFTVPSEYTSLSTAEPLAVGAMTLPLVGYHVAAYRYEYVDGHEYEQNGPVGLLLEPFPRLYVLVVTMFGSGVAIAVFGSPVGLIVLFVLAKTVLDVRAHRRERSADGQSSVDSVGGRP